jgi:hypothetical protein
MSMSITYLTQIDVSKQVRKIEVIIFEKSKIIIWYEFTQLQPLNIFHKFVFLYFGNYSSDSDEKEAGHAPIVHFIENFTANSSFSIV